MNSGLNILLVEDDPDFARTMRYRLLKQKNMKIEIQWASSLKQTLEFLKNEPFDLILLDLSLPDSRSIATYHRVHEEVPPVPIVILTGWDNDETAMQAMHCGAEDYLVKGEFDGKMVPRVIRYALERSRIRKELESLTGRLKRMPFHMKKDSLFEAQTGFLNRKGFVRALQAELSQAAGRAGPVQVVFLKLYGQPELFRESGSAAAEEAAKEISGIFARKFRAVDYSARLGEDLFAVLMPFASAEEAEELARSLPVRAGAGFNSRVCVVSVAANEVSYELLLSRALEQMKEADEGNRVSFTKVAAADMERAVKILDSIQRNRGVDVLTQPIIRLDTGAPAGYEFFSRLADEPSRSPAEFFEAADSEGQLSFVDFFCLRNSAAAASSFGDADTTWHFNLFPRTLTEISVNEIIETLRETGNLSRCCIELNLEEMSGQPFYLADIVKQLKGAGVQLALNGVFAGAGSFEALLVLEPDVIKLSPLWAGPIAAEAVKTKVLARLVRFCNTFNTKLVAEGLEEPDDLARLRQEGVPYAQGFLLGRPEPVCPARGAQE